MSLVRRLLGLLAMIGLAVGATVMLRRRLAQPKERVDVYFADGAMATFEGGDPEAEPFFALAREGIDAVRAL